MTTSNQLQEEYYKKSRGTRSILVKEPNLSLDKRDKLMKENDEYFKKYMFYKNLNKAKRKLRD